MEIGQLTLPGYRFAAHTARMYRFTIVLLVALCTSSCSRQNQGGSAAPTADATTASVAVLGDDTRNSFRDGLAHSACTAACPTTENAEDRALLIASADACVVVVDSTSGPRPIHREDLLLARQFSRGPVYIGFSKTTLVDDPELLELEELEMRELMNTYGLPGDTAAVFYDGPNATTGLPRGYSAAAEVLSRARRLDRGTWPRASRAELRATIYSLATREAFSTDLATTIETGTFDIVFATGRYEAQVKVDTPITPGAGGEATIVVESGIDAGREGRFVIVKDHHVIAAGSLHREIR